jgi:DNA-binding GntR family transcriptional regulator
MTGRLDRPYWLAWISTVYDQHMKKVDRFSPIQLHEQLTVILRNAIESGELGSRQKLLSESELMKEHEVSRGTVRVAIDKLRKDGLVVTFGSRGTFVADRTATIDNAPEAE